LPGGSKNADQRNAENELIKRDVIDRRVYFNRYADDDLFFFEIITFQIIRKSFENVV